MKIGTKVEFMGKRGHIRFDKSHSRTQTAWGVVFDEDVEFGWDLDGLLPPGSDRGYFLTPGSMKVIEEVRINEEFTRYGSLRDTHRQDDSRVCDICHPWTPVGSALSGICTHMADNLGTVMRPGVSYSCRNHPRKSVQPVKVGYCGKGAVYVDFDWCVL